MTNEADLELILGRTIVGKYRVDAPLGRGGMGAVYAATNLAIGKRVALKFLYREAARDLDAVTRFQREAEAASSVESAHIVQIFDSGSTEDGLPFLVMELLRGEDLRARLRRDGRVPVGDTVHIGAQVCRALHRAHEAGITHRDLKPDNVFLCQRDDDGLFVKIVDFGISKVSRKAASIDTLTRRGMVLGTAFYMAPEQAQAARDVDGRADLFSLGAILFESLAGRPPYTGSAYEAILIDICTKDAPDVRTLAPEVPEALASIISRALERNREDRFQSAREMLDALVGLDANLVHLGASERERRLVSSGGRPELGSGAGSSADVALRTADGAALGSLRPASGRRTRRTAVGVLVTALAAFAASALVLSRRPRPSEAEPPSAAPVLPAPLPRGLATRSEPAEPSTSSAAATASSVVVPVSAAAPIRSTGARKSPGQMSPAGRASARSMEAPRAPLPRIGGGVAKSLELAPEP